MHVATGVYHVHTTRSDGSGTVEEVAAAAARAGLRFVVFTDHGDGTRAPLPPAFRSGVLCLDAVEISTEGGHYVALGLPQTPYRLAGEARDVVEDVERLGGFGVAAHPDSPKPELSWHAWDAPIDGLEWFNLDTEWRDESRPRLLLALLHYPWRAGPSLGALVQPHRPLLARWDRLAQHRRIVGLAAVDAHARIGADAGPGGLLRLHVPGYQASFDAARVAVEMPAPLSTDPAQAAAAVLEALRAGRTYSWLQALAAAGRVELSAFRMDGSTAAIGEFAGPLAGVRLRGAAAAPPGSALRLTCDGKVVATAPAPGPVVHLVSAPAPAACRMEIGWDRGGAFAPWLVTNPIYGRVSDAPARGPAPLPVGGTSTPLPVDQHWGVEREPDSDGQVDRDPLEPRAVRFRYRLAPGPPRGQYAALVALPFTLSPEASALDFTVSADRPMRLSVQLREPDGGTHGFRWRRSVYVDASARQVRVRFDDLRAVAPNRRPHPVPPDVHALLFVVDTVNTSPGESGTVILRDVGIAGSSRELPSRPAR